MINVEDCVTNYILRDAPVSLRIFRLTGLNLSRIRPWTIALLAKFKNIEQFIFADIILPSDFEPSFLRACQLSFQTLSIISIVNSDVVNLFFFYQSYLLVH